MNTRVKKLVLNKETIRLLRSVDLKQVVGGRGLVRIEPLTEEVGCKGVSGETVCRCLHEPVYAR